MVDLLNVTMCKGCILITHPLQYQLSLKDSLPNYNKVLDDRQPVKYTCIYLLFVLLNICTLKKQTF